MLYKVIESNSTGFELTPKPTGRWYRGRSSTHFIPQVISLEKLAAEIQKGVIAPELVEYMKKIKPDPRYRYILVAPLGASMLGGAIKPLKMPKFFNIILIRIQTYL